MAQVTSGLVSVEDGIKKPEEYAPPRKVRVELSFSVGENEAYQDIFDTVSQAASNRVASLLGQKPVVVEPAEAAETPAPKRRRRTAAEIAEAGAKANGGSGGAQTSADPASMEDPTGGEETVIHLPDETPEDESFDIEPAAGEPEDESFDIEPAGSPDPISDGDLNSAVQKKNAEIANPNAIRTLISSYNPDPKSAFQLRQIPADKRGEFIAKLAALTKAA